MRIECENCSAAYTIEDALLSDQPIGAQCPYCGHVRVVRRGDPGILPSAAAREPQQVRPAGYGGPPAFDLEGPSYAGTGNGRGFADASHPRLPGFGPQVGGQTQTGSFGFDTTGTGSGTATGTGMRTTGPVPGGAFGLDAPPPPAQGLGGPSAVDLESRAVCQVCGTPLVDEFDKVIGLCETHQRERGRRSDFPDGDVPQETAEYWTKTAEGIVLGPFPLSEMRAKLQSGELSADGEFSRDGIEFGSIDAIPDLANLGRRSRDVSLAVPPTDLARPRTFIAPAKKRPSSISGWTVAIAIIGVILAAAGVAVALEFDRAMAMYEEYFAPQKRAKPLPPNPLKRQLAQWRTALPDASGTPQEHLVTARTRQLEDTWAGYRAADDSFKRALILAEDDPVAVAGYVENLALWKGKLLLEHEVKSAQAALRFAEAVSPDDAAVRRAKATLELFHGDLAQARLEAERALEKDPNDAAAKYLMGSAYLQGNLPLAIQETEAALKRNPGLKRAQVLLARAYASGGRYASASKLVNERLRTEPKHSGLLRLAGDIERELANFEAARTRYEAAINGEGDTAAARLALGELLLEKLDPQSALEVYQKVLKTPDLPTSYMSTAYTGLARAELGRRKWKPAAQAANSALEIAPGDAQALLIRAEIELETGSATAAQAFARRAVDARGGEPAILVVLGRAAVAQSSPEQAIRPFEEAIQNDPLDARLRGILAGMYLHFGGASQAYAVMRQAAEIDPMERYSRQRKGLFALTDLATLEAIRRFQDSTKDARNQSVAKSSMGLLYYHLGDAGRARESIDQALKVDDSNQTALVYDAQLALDAGNIERATKSTETLLDIDRASALGHLMLARIHLRQGKTAEAQEQYEAALRSAPSLLSAKIELAGLDLKKGNKEAAIEALVNAHRTYPGNITTRRLLFEAGY